MNSDIYNPAIPSFGGGTADDSGTLIAKLVVTLWRTLIVLGGLAVLIFLISGGLAWLTAGGDKAKVEAARDRITNALIGMVIVFASVAIVNFVGPAIGFDVLNLSFPNNL
jgi:hypothetical protein